ncbi:hypothetical protein ACQP3C_30370, partial [Escherichia coli]
TKQKCVMTLGPELGIHIQTPFGRLWQNTPKRDLILPTAEDLLVSSWKVINLLYQETTLQRK